MLGRQRGEIINAKIQRKGKGTPAQRLFQETAKIPLGPNNLVCIFVTDQLILRERGRCRPHRTEWQEYR